MENVNIGIANLIISNKLNESYFNDKLIGESKKFAFDFLNIIKNSPILQLEFKVYNNIESKHIENELLAKEYIDKHIELFEVYTLEEIEVEHEKLKSFINEDTVLIDDEKTKLYNAINTLITESLRISDEVDVDNIHESFTLVFNHVKSPKKALLENVDVELVNEDVLEIAVDKFNEKYASLDESDKDLLKTLIKATIKEKQVLLETYKTETLTILEGIDKENIQDNIAKAIQKIKEMIYDRKTVDDNIIGLHELKKELL
jgi:hypothetical protein